MQNHPPAAALRSTCPSYRPPAAAVWPQAAPDPQHQGWIACNAWTSTTSAICSAFQHDRRGYQSCALPNIGTLWSCPPVSVSCLTMPLYLVTLLPPSRTALCSVVTALRRSPPDTCRAAAAQHTRVRATHCQHCRRACMLPRLISNRLRAHQVERPAGPLHSFSLRTPTGSFSLRTSTGARLSSAEAIAVCRRQGEHVALPNMV